MLDVKREKIERRTESLEPGLYLICTELRVR